MVSFNREPARRHSVWKYTLKALARQTIMMPQGAKILDAQKQDGVTCLWALVQTDAPTEARDFVFYGTGEHMSSYSGKYIATVQIQGGTVVLHLFEVTI